jgi:hypothetical protein
MKTIIAICLLCFRIYAQIPACNVATNAAAICATTAVITIPANSCKDSLIAWMDSATPLAIPTAPIGAIDTTITVSGISATVTLVAGQATLIDRDPCLIVSVTNQSTNAATLAISSQPVSLVAVASHAQGATVKLLDYPNVVALFVSRQIFPGLNAITQALGSRSTNYPGSSGIAQ